MIPLCIILILSLYNPHIHFCKVSLSCLYAHFSDWQNLGPGLYQAVPLNLNAKSSQVKNTPRCASHRRVKLSDVDCRNWKRIQKYFNLLLRSPDVFSNLEKSGRKYRDTLLLKKFSLDYSIALSDNLSIVCQFRQLSVNLSIF